MKFHPIYLSQTSPYDYMGKSNFISARWDSFPPSICLDFLLGWVEKITWENFVPAVQKRDPNLPEWDFQVIARYNSQKFTALLGSRQNGTEFHPGQLRLCNKLGFVWYRKFFRFRQSVTFKFSLLFDISLEGLSKKIVSCAF